jgi:pimeloyl-ACP methyl ester carboxylesterase/DNA-binding CsgD family transcriptional regulator
MDRQIRFAVRPDGVRVAYAVVGSGPPLVVPPGWLSHLELSWDNPARRRYWEALASRHTLLQWDRHGCGLSDRDRTDFSWWDDLLDMETVVDELGLEEFPVLGESTGGPTSIAYVAHHPGRVSRLVLYGTGASKDVGRYPSLRVRPIIADLIRTDWSLASRALADIFYPSGADASTMAKMAASFRASASPEVAAALWDMDQEVTHLLDRVNVPVLVLHRKDEQIRPFEGGRDLALALPRARFLPLDGDLHNPAEGDWQSIVSAVLDFLEQPLPSASGRAVHPAAVEVNGGPPSARSSHFPVSLSAREVEVLRLMAAGRTNKQIAESLTISTRTVANHIANIFAKTGASNRVEATNYAHRNFLA